MVLLDRQIDKATSKRSKIRVITAKSAYLSLTKEANGRISFITEATAGTRRWIYE
jgi:hypothetical protein